jgi:hypothetical protein
VTTPSELSAPRERSKTTPFTPNERLRFGVRARDRKPIALFFLRPGVRCLRFSVQSEGQPLVGTAKSISAFSGGPIGQYGLCVPAGFGDSTADSFPPTGRSGFGACNFGGGDSTADLPFSAKLDTQKECCPFVSARCLASSERYCLNMCRVYPHHWTAVLSAPDYLLAATDDRQIPVSRRQFNFSLRFVADRTRQISLSDAGPFWPCVTLQTNDLTVWKDPVRSNPVLGAGPVAGTDG